MEEVSKIVTRSMTDAKRKEMRRDEISTFWMQVENSECFDEIAIYTVEVPVREHKLPEVIDAKQKEIQNLENIVFLRKLNMKVRRQQIQHG